MRYWPRRAAAVLAIAGIALLAGISSATAATLPTGFEERTVVSGLTAPTAVAWAPDGRMFVAEKGGKVRVVTAAGALVSKPLVDISGHVNTQRRPRPARASPWTRASPRTSTSTCSIHTTPRRSAVGPAEVVPAHAGDGEPGQHRVRRRPCCSAASPRSRARTPANNVDCIPSDSNAHSIGTVRSVADGTLWVGSATARTTAGPTRRRCARTTSRASAARSSTSTATATGCRGTPSARRSPTSRQVCTKVCAKGFRNPFRFTIRPERPARGRRRGLGLLGGARISPSPGATTAGPATRASRGPAATRAWRPARTSTRSEGTPAGVTFPDYLYAHGSGAAIVGGPTYTGGPYPDEFDGDIIFGDYVQGFIKRLELDGSGKLTGTKDFATDWYGRRPRALERRALLRRASATAAGGRARSCASPTRPNNSTPIAVATATPTFGAAPLKVTFKGSGSSDPDGDTLKYEWDFGDGTAKSTAKDPRPHLHEGRQLRRAAEGDRLAGTRARPRPCASRSTTRRRS